uniref:uncharacterized protein n=1 Tax=Myxine glutinosa TaxID=7769 RepID=UPI00358EDB2D
MKVKQWAKLLWVIVNLISFCEAAPTVKRDLAGGRIDLRPHHSNADFSNTMKRETEHSPQVLAQHRPLNFQEEELLEVRITEPIKKPVPHLSRLLKSLEQIPRSVKEAKNNGINDENKEDEGSGSEPNDGSDSEPLNDAFGGGDNTKTVNIATGDKETGGKHAASGAFHRIPAIFSEKKTRRKLASLQNYPNSCWKNLQNWLSKTLLRP